MNADENETQYYTIQIANPRGFEGDSYFRINGYLMGNHGGPSVVWNDPIVNMDTSKTSQVMLFDQSKIVRFKFMSAPLVDNGITPSRNVVAFSDVITNIYDETSTDSKSIRFVWKLASGVYSLFAVVSNGVSNTNIDLTGSITIANTQLNTYEWIWDPANTKVDFYFDGALVGTITTNIPTSADETKLMSTHESLFSSQTFINPVMSVEL